MITFIYYHFGIFGGILGWLGGGSGEIGASSGLEYILVSIDGTYNNSIAIT